MGEAEGFNSVGLELYDCRWLAVAVYRLTKKCCDSTCGPLAFAPSVISLNLRLVVCENRDLPERGWPAESGQEVAAGPAGMSQPKSRWNSNRRAAAFNN